MTSMAQRTQGFIVFEMQHREREKLLKKEFITKYIMAQKMCFACDNATLM